MFHGREDVLPPGRVDRCVLHGIQDGLKVLGRVWSQKSCLRAERNHTRQQRPLLYLTYGKPWLSREMIGGDTIVEMQAWVVVEFLVVVTLFGPKSLLETDNFCRLFDALVCKGTVGTTA